MKFTLDCSFTTAENHVTSKNPVDSGKTFIDISVNTGQVGMGFVADTP